MMSLGRLIGLLSKLGREPVHSELSRAVKEGVATPAHHVQYPVRVLRGIPDTVQDAEGITGGGAVR